MKLYGSRTSPFVRKARVAFEELGVPYSFEVADPWSPTSLVPGLNPLGKVPVLETDEGVLFDSFAVIDHVDRLHGSRLIPLDDPARTRVLRGHALAQGVMDATVACVLEGRRPETLRSQAQFDREDARIARTLDAIESEMTEGRFSTDLSLAAVTLGVALLYVDFRRPHDWRSRRPALADWIGEIATRRSFTETRPPEA